MKILIIGNESNLREFKQKFGEHHICEVVEGHRDAEKFLNNHDLVFDFIIDEEPEEFEIYLDKPITVFLNTCKITLAELSYTRQKEFRCTIFGFNGLPTFLNRNILEASLFNKADEGKMRKICDQLSTDVSIVDDRVGFVTPRVVCMIINEAYYALQEGTASREDIDKAMKLGTNYPAGPFEWCQKIGVAHVYELLDALYEDTKDERYKICPLLKREYLKQLDFSEK
jgi:3-hydroxybutyryl-CoA dehydrogenase